MQVDQRRSSVYGELQDQTLVVNSGRDRASSAEAELYAATRAISGAKGLASLGQDFGESL